MKKLIPLTVLYISSIILFTSCTASYSPEVYNRKAKFIDSEYTPYGVPGTSTITGQAFLKTRGGDVKFGAGCVIWLNPVTTYSKEWYEKSVIKGYMLSEADPQTEKYHWETIADGFGNFEFKNLPAGNYYIACNITWQVPGKYGLEGTGGTAYAQTSVKEGGVVKVVVTR